MTTQPCWRKLRDLLDECRPDWPLPEIDRALWQCQVDGSTFEQAYRAVGVFLPDPGAKPDRIPQLAKRMPHINGTPRPERSRT